MTCQHLNLGRTTPEQPSQSEPYREPRLVKAGTPLSVLIVEDDTLVAGLLTDAIKDHGGQVIGVADIPSDAFGMVVEHRPDAVIMDVRLKDGHDGLHAAEAMRLLHHTPIVFCTGYGDVQIIERIRQFGGSQCLLKPVQADQLAHAILRACGL
jgi:CheY-like chemotaxis protein